ncbi:LOW QUALITY PROTEIN: origin recognition complex subunit 4-like [Clytia hemisphaerica]|uniref:LOW QUALITY PROTEIN: origin recognition complex subunit 4-like n=1 Tax=Clytia hemisphaerica TaxID=252671 RepID=UPI0034D62AB4
MPTKKKAIKKSLKENLDDVDVPCCDSYLTCPYEAKNTLKEHLFKVNSGFYIPGIYDNQLRQLETVINQCVECGESNSVLVIGPRGSGKSKLLSKVFIGCLNNHGSDYFYVYLSGLIHTDDRSALQDLARQLELENVIGDRVFGSFADNLAFILDALKNDNGQSKSVILVLDEFDLFAYHKNQSLLYNLFDIAQSKQNPLCVIGLTCRLDVVELLEKRVKSRYSHRAILTFPSYSFEEYVDIVSSFLKLSEDFSCKKFRDRWNRNLDENLSEGSVCCEILLKQYNLQKDFQSLIRLLTPVVYGISNKKPFISNTDFVEAYTSLHIDSKTALLNGLSTLELSLLVAAKHVFNRREGQPFNYEMVYNEYENFLKRRLSGMQNFNKAVAYKAYEHLISLELLKSTETLSINSTSKEFKAMTLLLEPSQIKEIVYRYPECPTELRQWADSMFVY